MEEYENKISKLNTENKSMGKETWILKEENELLNSKVNLLEKQEEQIQKDFSTLEARVNQGIFSLMTELVESSGKREC